MSKLPEDLQTIVENLNPFQRKYCEFRAKGMSQGLSAEKAGSNAEGKPNLNRIGYQVEQMTGVKEYILWLQQQRAKVAMIDDVEILDKLRKIYDQAVMLDKLKEANTSVELMGKLIGLFGTKVTTADAPKQEGVANNTSAFKDEGEEPDETDTRISKLQQMLKDLNQGK